MNKIFKIVGIVLLLIVTFIVFGNRTSLKPFDLDEAISNGTLINMHGFITNLDSLDNFVKDIENRKDSEIEIVHYTIEGDPIIHILKYENNVIHSTLDPRHDQFGNSDVIKEEYDSIEVKEVHRNETIYKQYKLTSDNEESIFFTYELGIEETHVNEIEGSYFSAESDITGLVELLKINDEVWVHRTYYDYNGKKVSSNGLVIISSDMLVMVDTPWTNEQTETLITLAEEHFARAFSLAFVTHAHMDRMGGIDTLLDKGINVQSSELTIVEAEKNGFAKPEFMLNENMYMPIRGKAFEFYYPGEGHAKDNMVLWLPDSKILYGACLVKSLKSKTLGSLADANIEAWPQSLVNLKERYPNADTVIPGHGEWGSSELIDHTLELLLTTEEGFNSEVFKLYVKKIDKLNEGQSEGYGAKLYEIYKLHKINVIICLAELPEYKELAMSHIAVAMGVKEKWIKERESLNQLIGSNEINDEDISTVKLFNSVLDNYIYNGL